MPVTADRYCHVSPAGTPRCACGAVVVGKMTVRREYTLVTCLNRTAGAGRSCGRKLILLPLPMGHVKVIELSPLEAARLRDDELVQPLPVEWLQVLGAA